MTFDEFEAQIQDLIDEDRFAEANALLATVRNEDFDRCSELLAGYESMLIGLAAWQAPDMSGRFVEHVVDKVHSTTRQDVAFGSRRGWETWLPYFAMAVAASMAAVMVSPAILYDREVAPIAWRQLLPEPSQPSDVGSTVAERDRNVSEPQVSELHASASNASLAEATIPVVSVMAESEGQFGGSFPDGLPLDRLAMSWTAGDSQLFSGPYYVETAPLIESVSRGLRPLTETMGSAIGIIRDSTIPGSQPLPLEGPPQASRPTDGPAQQMYSA